MSKKILRIEELIKGCIKNNNSSKETMYKLFYGYLMGIILRYNKNTEDNEELVNDTFIKIFKNIKSFNIPAENTLTYFKAWIGKIASRTAIDKLRSNKIKFQVLDIEDYEHPATEISTSENLYVQDILNLLNQLPDTHRLVFNLFEIEGFKHHEIAELLNIPENSSRVYLTRSKNALRQLYSKTLSQAQK
jgi:RNA polymerase sigma factor (sigma-70 family)